MFSKQVVSRTIFAAVAIKECTQVCKASELPLYEKDGCKEDLVVCTPKPSAVENTIGSVRRQIWDVMDQLSVYQNSIKQTVNEGEEYVSSMFKYLSTEANDTTKMAAIGAGAFTGVVLGLRGGIIRKLFYSGVGAYGMSAICYPQETQRFTRDVINETRKNSTIAYNFVFGISKDDNSPSLPQLPELGKLPSSMDEVWEIASSIGKSASSMIPDIQSFLGKETAEEKEKEKVMSSSDDVVQQSHDTALHSECHCPVGACLGRHQEQKPPRS